MRMNVNKTQGERSQQGQESPTDAFLGSSGEMFLSHVGIRKGSTDLIFSMDIVASYALFMYLFTCSLGGGRNGAAKSSLGGRKMCGHLVTCVLCPLC